MEKPLELQDLSGEIFLVEHWFNSDDIIGLIYKTHPSLQNANFIVPQDDEDYKADRKYNDSTRVCLLQSQSGPFAMVIYQEVK